MWNGRSAFDTDIDYAVRMVKTGCASLEQAARTCGIPLPVLEAHLKGATPAGAAALTNTLEAPHAARVKHPA
jgi:hypothetical protein